MSSGKSKSSRKTREPYERVTEVGQVPIAFQEIRELAAREWQRSLERGGGTVACQIIADLMDSVIAVTSQNPGCLSEMAEGRVQQP